MELSKQKEIFSELNYYPCHCSLTTDNIDHFKNVIKGKIHYLYSNLENGPLGGHLSGYYNESRFENSFNRLKSYLENKKGRKTPYSDFYNNMHYFEYLDDLLYLGIWDDRFTNDLDNNLSPLGALFLIIQKFKIQQSVGIIQAATQQMIHPYNDNLLKAQKLANLIFSEFQALCTQDEKNERADENYPPIIQLYDGGSAALLCGLPCPGFILMDERKADKFSNFSSIPHECGHVILHTTWGSKWLDEIKKEIDKKNFTHDDIWKHWLEECVADAIAVATIKEGEILSLANIFADEPTNIIYKKSNSNEMDEHPARHLRILLTIEVAKKLGITIIQASSNGPGRGLKSIDRIKEEWEKNGKIVNIQYGPNQVMNLSTNKHHYMKNFEKSIKTIAEAIVNTPFIQNGQSTLKKYFKKGVHQKDIPEALNESIKSYLLKKLKPNIAKNAFK